MREDRVPETRGVAFDLRTDPVEGVGGIAVRYVRVRPYRPLAGQRASRVGHRRVHDEDERFLGTYSTGVLRLLPDHLGMGAAQMHRSGAAHGRFGPGDRLGDQEVDLGGARPVAEALQGARVSAGQPAARERQEALGAGVEQYRSRAAQLRQVPYGLPCMEDAAVPDDVLGHRLRNPATAAARQRPSRPVRQVAEQHGHGPGREARQLADCVRGDTGKQGRRFLALEAGRAQRTAVQGHPARQQQGGRRVTRHTALPGENQVDDRLAVLQQRSQQPPPAGTVGAQVFAGGVQ